MEKFIKITVFIIFILTIALVSIISENKLTRELKAQTNSSNILADNETIEKKEEIEKNDSEVYAIIRPDQNGNWYILDDSGHTPSGDHFVEQNEKFITLHYAYSLEDIHWSTINPDETLIANNINTGASVGLNSARIYLAKDGDIVDPSSIKQTGANVWIYIKGE